MFGSKQSRRASERATEYATCKDFQQIFREDMAGLHLLAYLLTADQAKAEQCFVAGLEDSIHGNPVFKQWARAWSKRAIIQNAIKAMVPFSATESAEPVPFEPNGQQSALISMVLHWSVFERFVFVMSVLEGYAVRECAALLACTDHEVLAAKSRVLERLADGAWQAAAVIDSPRWNAVFAQAQTA